MCFLNMLLKSAIKKPDYIYLKTTLTLITFLCFLIEYIRIHICQFTSNKIFTKILSHTIWRWPHPNGVHFSPCTLLVSLRSRRKHALPFDATYQRFHVILFLSVRPMSGVFSVYSCFKELLQEKSKVLKYGEQAGQQCRHYERLRSEETLPSNNPSHY